MTGILQLWQRRFRDTTNEVIRYLRLIANSGFMFSLYVAFILGAYYYNKLLDWLPQTFPAAFFIAVIMTFLLVRSPIRTFLKAPDLVFLLPLETKMKVYFRKSLHYSLTMQSALLIFVMFLLSPLYFARINENFFNFVLTLVVLCAFKYWNVTASWEEMHLQTKRARCFSVLLRMAVSFSFVFLLFSAASIYFLVIPVFLLPLLSYFYYQPLEEKHTLKWARLLEVEERQVMGFYRIANLFTDVPKLKSRVRPRRWLSRVSNQLPFQKATVFTVLYFKTFLRASDYFGVYMRLLLIGGIVLYFLPQGYGQFLVLLLILYISGLQLYTLWRHPSPASWEQIYPISDKIRRRSFLQVVFTLLIVKSLLFTVVLLASGLVMVKVYLSLGVGLGFSLWFAQSYLRKKIS